MSNPGGFGAGSLSGTYVFSSEGSDAINNLLVFTGAFVADGKGGITGGTMDVVDSGIAPTSPVAQSITSGSYSVNTDGRGQVKLNSAAGKFTFQFVLVTSPSGAASPSSHGLISEYDGNGSGSGTLDLQTSVPTLAQLAGPFAFGLAGIDSTNDPFGSAGALVLDSAGNITTGIEDFNAGGIVFSGQALSGAATAASGTAPGSFTLTTTSFALTFDYYPMDATHLKLIETDLTDLLAGDAFTQTGASAIPAGTLVFTMAGGTTAGGPVAAGGLMTSDGTGHFTNGREDVNNAGSVSPAQLPFTGNPGAPAGTGGRTVINLGGFTPAIQWVVYPSRGGLLMLETDGLNVMEGVAFVQTATSFSAGNSVGYGLNLSGANPLSEVDDIAQFNATTAASSNMTGILNENDQGTPLASMNFTGTYTPDSPATGRGFIVIPGLKTPLGGLSLEYYVVDGSNALFIEIDPNPSPQVAAGTFQEQGVGPALGAEHTALVHPAVAPHAAMRRK